MLEFYFKNQNDKEFRHIEEPVHGSLIAIGQAKLQDLEHLSTIISIEVSDLRDSLDKYEFPRVEKLGESTIFFTRHPGEQEAGLHTEPLTIVLTPSYLVSISPYTNKVAEQLLLLNPDLPTVQRSKLLLFLLLRITQDFTNSIKRVLQSILIYKEPTKDMETDAIIVLTKNEEILNQYLTALVPLRNLMQILSKERYVTLHEKDLDLLEDLMIATQQSEDLCRVNVKSIRSLRDSYQIIFTNDVNKTIKRLTALTILFSIPTIIASIYGMNVPLPYQGSSVAFPLVLAFSACVCTTSILIFRKNRWL